VLPVKLLSPPYAAVMEWDPRASAEVVSVACALPFSEPVPRAAVPSMNVTVPVGVPEPEVAVTVAVNVTDCPIADGFTDDFSVVALAAWLTTWLKVADALAWKFVSPP